MSIGSVGAADGPGGLEGPDGAAPARAGPDEKGPPAAEVRRGTAPARPALGARIGAFARSLVDKVEEKLGLDGRTEDRPAADRADFVRHVLDVVPRPLRNGPLGGELRARVEALADAVGRADAYYREHQVYRDDDVRAVNAAAARVTELDPCFTLSDVDEGRRDRLPALVLDTVNLFARLRGAALHEGTWDGEKWTTWNREVTVYPERYYAPAPPEAARTKAEVYAPLASVVRGAASLRVVAGGHSFNESSSTGGTAAAPKGALLSLDRYDRMTRLSPEAVAARFGVTGERAERFVHVEAGKRLRDLTRELWDLGLAMPVAGSTDAQSLGGLIATDLHGTGREHAYLSEALREVTVMRADGSLVAFTKRGGAWVTDEKPPQRFEHLPVSGALGTLGVVVDAVLELDPAYHLEKGARYVSREEAQANIEEILAAHDHVSFYYPGGVRDPKTVRMNTWDRTDERPKWTAPLSRLRHELTDHAAASFAPDVLASVGRRDPKTDPLVKALNADDPEVLPAPAAFARRLFYQHDEIEYGVPMSAYPEALDAVMDLLADEEFETVVEVRFAPDTTEGMIGPGTAGRGKGGTVFIELATATGRYSDARIAEVYEKFDRVLRDYGGRAHLGKKAPIDEADMAATYGENWRRFQELRRAWDPSGKLVPRENTFLSKVFLGEG